MTSYVDQLLRDMELPTRRADGLFTEYFDPLDVERPKSLTEERRRARAG